MYVSCSPIETMNQTNRFVQFLLFIPQSRVIQRKAANQITCQGLSNEKLSQSFHFQEEVELEETHQMKYDRREVDDRVSLVENTAFSRAPSLEEQDDLHVSNWGTRWLILVTTRLYWSPYVSYR